jgi:hypothetical protein
MSVSVMDFLPSLTTDTVCERGFTSRRFASDDPRFSVIFQDVIGKLPRLGGRRIGSSVRRADGVSSPNLACLLTSKQPGTLLNNLRDCVTGFCYFLGR